MQRVVMHFVAHSVVAATDNAVIDFSNRAQVLARHMIGGAALLAVAPVINDQDTVRRRGRGRFTSQQRQSFGIDRFAVPGSLGEEKGVVAEFGKNRTVRIGLSA